MTICVGSSCHLKGSRSVIELFQRLVAERKLEEKVILSGAFCMGRCMDGVCVTVDDKPFAVKPETAEAFFEREIMAKL